MFVVVKFIWFGYFPVYKKKNPSYDFDWLHIGRSRKQLDKSGYPGAKVKLFCLTKST